MASSSSSFYFGIEIELLMGSRKKVHSTWKGLAGDLSKRLAKAGISNHVNEANNKSPDNYREWSIVPEVTIPGQPAKGLYGLELVSPVYPSSWTWAEDLEAIFAVLQASFMVTPSPHCSTHVHVSTNPTLSADELATLAKAILYFEPALDALVPPNRRGSTAYWCQSNRANPALKSLSGMGECFAAVDYAASGADCGGGGGGATSGVIETLNLFPAASAYGRSHGKKHDFVRGKVYKWDLTGLGSSRGTLEFRQPPGSMNASQARGWAELALAFVGGAASAGFDVVDLERGASVEELWALLCQGADVLGFSGEGIAGVFAARN